MKVILDILVNLGVHFSGIFPKIVPQMMDELSHVLHATFFIFISFKMIIPLIVVPHLPLHVKILSAAAPFRISRLSKKTWAVECRELLGIRKIPQEPVV